jgi:hypothetical protein
MTTGPDGRLDARGVPRRRQDHGHSGPEFHTASTGTAGSAAGARLEAVPVASTPPTGVDVAARTVSLRGEVA